MNYKQDCHKGVYTVINKEKYAGIKNPIYKSGWERRCFDVLDRNPNVLKWGYETVEIYYYNPVQCRFTTYYPDILCQVLNGNGETKTALIEIKPAVMTVPPRSPTTPKGKTAKDGKRYMNAMKRYHESVKDFAVNAAKWEAARKRCAHMGIQFIIMTEDNAGFLK